jgi:AcrR family transcriptional regulator
MYVVNYIINSPMVFFKNFDQQCRKRDRKATERAILLAASKLFAEKGYENTRTLEIAKVAGANEALITRYFGGKDGLLAAVMKNEEALQIVIDQKQACGASAFEEFPAYPEGKDLKSAMLQFFKNGVQVVAMKQEFMKIGSSRCLVDPEMATAIKTQILDRQMPAIIARFSTYPELKNRSEKELSALALLLMTTNYNMNFQSRLIYKMDPAQVDRALEIFAESMSALYSTVLA